MKILGLAFLLVLLIQFNLCSQSLSARQKISLDTDWKFQLGNASDPKKDYNYGIANLFSKSGKAEETPISNKYDDQSWSTIQVPHDWAVSLPFERSDNPDVMAHGYKSIGGMFPGNSIGWYRKGFSISKQDFGQRFSIKYDGVFRDAKVWVNGFYLGTNESGYVGFSYDLTDFLNYVGKSNK